MNAAQSCWKIDGTEALLCCGPLQAQVLLHAFPRLVPQRWGDKPFDDVAPLLFRGPDAADGRLTLREAYTRLDDLVLTYDLAAPLHMTAQLYWRASHVADGVTRVALILSLQTDLLDSQPITTVETLVRNANFFHIDNLNDPRATPVMPPATPDNVTAIGPHSLWLARNSTQGITYAELVHPADLVATELDSSDTTTGWRRVRTKIFPERLEKGVIRRARLCGWFLPSENDEQVAARVARQYLGEPLPLTT